MTVLFGLYHQLLATCHQLYQGFLQLSSWHYINIVPVPHTENLFVLEPRFFQSVHVSYGETEKVNARKLCPEMETPKMPLGTEVDKLLTLDAVLKKKKKLFTETDVQSCSLLC